MTPQRRALVLAGRALCALGLIGAAGIAVIRSTGIQELGFRMMGIAGVSVALMGLAAGLALLGATLQLVGHGRHDRLTRWSVVAAALPVLLVVEMTAPALRGAVAPERAEGGTEFSVISQNLYFQNDDVGATLRAVLARRSDVVVLTEFTPAADRALDALAPRHVRRYRHQWREPRRFGGGLAVLSTLPFERVTRMPLSEPAVQVRLRVGGHDVDLHAVHPVAPSDRWGLLSWQHDYRVLTDDARDASPRALMVGDFNASTGHRAFRRLLREGRLRDAQDVGGAGLAGTWPSGWPIPPVMRLDHVLVGRGIGVRDVEILPHTGSDHRAVEAWLTVPRT